MILPGENPAEFGGEDYVWKLLEPWGLDPDQSVLERAAVTRFQGKYLEEWRAGKALFV